jgi:hypothetical protein
MWKDQPEGKPWSQDRETPQNLEHGVGEGAVERRLSLLEQGHRRACRLCPCVRAPTQKHSPQPLPPLKEFMQETDTMVTDF